MVIRPGEAVPPARDRRARWKSARPASVDSAETTKFAGFARHTRRGHGAGILRRRRPSRAPGSRAHPDRARAARDPLGGRPRTGASAGPANGPAPPDIRLGEFVDPVLGIWNCPASVVSRCRSAGGMESGRLLAFPGENHVTERKTEPDRTDTRNIRDRPDPCAGRTARPDHSPGRPRRPPARRPDRNSDRKGDRKRTNHSDIDRDDAGSGVCDRIRRVWAPIRPGWFHATRRGPGRRPPGPAGGLSRGRSTAPCGPGCPGWCPPS
ncbi:hypothetical protein EHYA_09158 [Embleya hyalina]|uniref:Uncharacterized protein n=1 Tax=Embleya hyalina TaxID=516124 RepID=A0A401Z3E1_9ACTN|nr:hypothetical protein EHYA_09158 [Embleya hyalina]